MALRSSRRRLSLDMLQRAVSDMDLIRLPSHSSSSSSSSNEVSKVECECCGLSEDCTHAYVRRVRDRFCGRWVCGLCSEAVKDELERLGLARHVVKEEALTAHMEVCKRFNGTVRVNPAMSLATAMTEILKKSSQAQSAGARGSPAARSGVINRGVPKVGRSYSIAVPSHGL